MNSLIMKLIGIMTGGIVLVYGGMYLEQHHIGSALSAVASETVGKLFRSATLSSARPAFEVSLTENSQKNEGAREIEASSASTDMNFFVPVPEPTQKDEASPERPVQATTTASTSHSTTDSQGSSKVSSESYEDIHCNFSLTGGVSHTIRLNEIAWMGSTASASDEWIELMNEAPNAISLSGWQIVSSDAKFRILFVSGEKISGKGLYLLERTDDSAVPGVTADKTYAGALANGGLWLKLFNEKCEVIDEVDARAGFSTLGGDASARKTLERNADGMGWHTSASVNGTPKRENSVPTPTVTIANPTPTTTIPVIPAPTPAPEVTPTTTPFQNPAPAPTPEPFAMSNTIIVNEVMVGVDGASDNEFIELYNASDVSVSLTGWSMKKKSSTGSESSLVAVSRFEGKSIPAHGYLLLGNETGYTGTTPLDISWPHSYSLAYTNNAVLLYNNAGVKVSDLNWAEIPTGKSFGRKSDGTMAVLSSLSPRIENE